MTLRFGHELMSIFDTYPKLLDMEYLSGYDLDDCWTKSEKNETRSYDDQDVAVALLLYSGNISAVAKALGRGRRSVETFILRNYDLRELQEDIEAEFLDAIEYGYKQDAINGDANARRFFLTTKGKDRGYVTRAESTGPNGGPIEVEHKTFDISGMTIEELKVLEKFLAGKVEGSTNDAGDTVELEDASSSNEEGN